MTIEEKIDGLSSDLREVRDSLFSRLYRLGEGQKVIYWTGLLVFLGYVGCHGYGEDLRYKHMAQQLDTITEQCTYPKSEGKIK